MSQETEFVRQVNDDDLVLDVILQVVADISDRPIRELPVLQESIDVDALEQLFASSATIQSVRFEYAGYEVTVYPNRVRVNDL